MISLLHFDGDGGLSGTEGYQVVGFAYCGTPARSFTGGTYEILPDCSITASIPTTTVNTITLSIQGVVLDVDGREVIGEVFAPRLNAFVPPGANPLTDVQATFDMKKVSDSE